MICKKNRTVTLWMQPLRLLGFCFTVGAALTIAQTPTPEPALVVVGSPLERQLKGGESQQFRIAAVSGQFLQLAVEQMGVDVVLDLFKPDGQLLISVDSPNGRYGSEDVAVITESSGDYRLEVRSPAKADPLGQFKLSVIALHSPTPTDLERVAAETAFNEAFPKLAPKRTAEARREAIEKCRVALAFFRSSGEQRRQAWIMNTISLLLAQSGDFRQAFDLAVEILPIFRSVGDNLGISTSINNLGGMSDVLGEPQRALGYYKEALTVSRSAGDTVNEGIILNNIGKIYNDEADWQRSIEYYNQALPLFLGNARLEGNTLHNIAVAYYGLGEFESSLKLLQQALVLRRTAKDKPGEAETLTVLGDLTSLQGRPEEAIEIYKQAMALRLVVGDRRNEGVTLDHIGIAYASLNQPERALEYHLQALERHRAAQSPRTEAISLGNIGHAYQRLNQPDKAVVFYSQALSTFERLGDRQNEARMQEGLANAQRSLGNFDAALKHVTRALDQIESVRTAAGAQQARSAYAASRHGAYELYIDLLMQMHRLNPTAGYDAQALQASERARARSFIEILGEARVDFRQGVDPKLIASERALGQRINAKAQRQIQIRSQKVVNAEEIRQLDTEISALESEYQQVQSSIRKDSPSYASLTQPKAITVKDIQAELDPDTVLLEYSLGDKRSFVWVVSPTSLKAFEIPGRSEIDNNARKVYELLSTGSKAAPDVEPAVQAARLAEFDSVFADVAAKLTRQILAPVAGELGDKRLLIAADGSLQYVPFAALPDAGSAVSDVNSRVRENTLSAGSPAPLIVRHEIVNVPSASAMAAQRAYLSGRKPAPKGIAVIADPVFSIADVRLPADVRSAAAATSPAGDGSARGLEHTSEGEISRISIRRLPFTRQEADQILAVAPKLSNLRSVDFDASRVTGTSSELSQYRYVHFATHGYLDTQRPGLSAIVLSLVDRQGKPQDGFLRTHDIYDLKLPAELVVLSACQTGLGKEVKGEGLIGLTRGFMYAGAKRVVVSLWSVNDRATADLMTSFYRGIFKNGERPAAALRAAQIEMWKQKKWQSPYYWAAFTMQGEWR